MYLDTAASETSKPSILSSPWIRGAPHNGFSRDIRRISPRNSLDTGGRPGFPRRDFRVQKRRKPFRCQPITVSGLTITRISLQPDHSRDRTTQKRRSANRQGNVLRGHRESIGERFVRDREALKRPLPAPFDACDKQGTRVNSLSLVRYRTNDYSVPVAYGHQEVWIRGYVHEVVIGCGAGIIARHPRSYDREDMVFDPIHYLPLLEHKIGALDQAAPLAGWELPDAFPTLRRLLEARMGKAGKREYVQVPRLLETFDLEVLHGAVKDALRLGAIGYDAVKHLVLCRIERRPPGRIGRVLPGEPALLPSSQ